MLTVVFFLTYTHSTPVSYWKSLHISYLLASLVLTLVHVEKWFLQFDTFSILHFERLKYYRHSSIQWINRFSQEALISSMEVLSQKIKSCRSSMLVSYSPWSDHLRAMWQSCEWKGRHPQDLGCCQMLTSKLQR